MGECKEVSDAQGKDQKRIPSATVLLVIKAARTRWPTWLSVEWPRTLKGAFLVGTMPKMSYPFHPLSS